MTGLRVPADDEAALAAALIRLFSLSDARARRDRRGAAAPGSRTISTPPSIERATLALYAEVDPAARLTACEPCAAGTRIGAFGVDLGAVCTDLPLSDA